MPSHDDGALEVPGTRDRSAPGPVLRASDAEREATIDRLRDAAAEGRLTLEELADRVEAATGARHRAELERITHDLPAVAQRERRPAAADIETRSVFGDLRRSGPWLVPASSRWSTVFGDIELDLREAGVASDEVTIEAGTVFGDVQLLVPEGVVVEVRARTLFGGVKQEASAAAPAGAPRIVLVGNTVFGDVRVRTRRLRERIAERLRAGAGDH
jgi:hypothetical protein